MADTLKYDIAKSFQRTKEFPLDRTSVFNSLAAATSYAAGEGSLGKTSYPGQILAVVEGTSVEVYKIGFDATTGKKVLMSIGSGEGGGNAVTTESVTIGDVTIPVGSDLTFSLHAISAVVDSMGSTDGTLSEDIIVNGQVYATGGTPITTVIGDLYSKVVNNAVLTENIMSGSTLVLSKGSNLTTVAKKLMQLIASGGTAYITEPITDNDGNVIIPTGYTVTEAIQEVFNYYNENPPVSTISGGTDIRVTEREESGTVIIDVEGISNPDIITLDEKKTITLSFNPNGGTFTGSSLVDYTWGDFIEFTLPEESPVLSGYEFAGWKIDSDINGTIEEPNEIYHPGSTVRIINLTNISEPSYEATATALWVGIM